MIGVTLESQKLGSLAVRRNPLIIDLFHGIHLVEKMGTGIRRIREECKDHGNVKFMVDTNGYFIAMFKLKRVGKTTQKIIEFIKEDSKITRKELADKIGLTEDGIKYHLKKMQENGIIKRIGPGRGGYWKVKNKVIWEHQGIAG